jgi:HEAT repeat protein
MATLQELLESSDQSVRLKAALAAGTYPEPDYIDILVTQCAHEPDFFVRDTLSWALMRNDIPKVVERLKLELQSRNALAKSQAIHTFSKIGDKQNYFFITEEMMRDADDLVATTAWRAASVLVPDTEKPALVKILLTQLGRGDSDSQFALTRFLCAIGDEIVEPLTEAAKSENEVVRTQAEFTLMRYREMRIEDKRQDFKGNK